MKTPILSILLLAIASAFGAQTTPLHLKLQCNECPGDSEAQLRESFEKGLSRHGFQLVDSLAKGPTLRVYAYRESGHWFLAPTLSSPKGTVVSVSREEFGESLKSVLGGGVDSTLALARRTVDEAMKRAKEAPKTK